MKSRSSATKHSSSGENDWRTSGRSREQSTSLLKKRSEPTGSSSSGILNECENNILEQRKNSISHSTRREMRGLMKAIDTASSDQHNHQNYRDRKEARIVGDRLTDTSSKPTIGKKSSLSNTSISPSRISPQSQTSIRTESSNGGSSNSTTIPSSPKKLDQTEMPNRHSHQEASPPLEPQIQTRQSNAENSFIQRVRRYLFLLIYFLSFILFIFFINYLLLNLSNILTFFL